MNLEHIKNEIEIGVKNSDIGLSQDEKDISIYNNGKWKLSLILNDYNGLITEDYIIKKSIQIIR